MSLAFAVLCQQTRFKTPYRIFSNLFKKSLKVHPYSIRKTAGGHLQSPPADGNIPQTVNQKNVGIFLQLR